MLGRVASKPKEVPAKTPVGRERLISFQEGIQKGEIVVGELEQQIQRLESIIADADQAHLNLQQAIAADGGVELTAYSAGKASDSFSKLVMSSENTSRAATAAKASLPTTNSALENARAQILALSEQRAAELQHVLTMLADEVVRSYQAAFETLGRLHDRLVGYCSVAESNQGDIFLTQEPLRANRFASPSSGNSDADPFLRHKISSVTVGESARTWQTVKDRLADNAQADLSDLLS